MAEHWELIEASRGDAKKLAAEGWEPLAVTTGASPFGGTITFHLRRLRPQRIEQHVRCEGVPA